MAHLNNREKLDEVSFQSFIIKIKTIFLILLHQWKIILLLGFIGACIGLVASILKKPIYKAELSFALEDDRAPGGAGLGAAMGLASQFGIDLGGTGGGAFSGDNLLELMKSRSMVEKTLLTTIDFHGKKTTLAELYIQFNEYHEKWNEDPRLRGIQFLNVADRSKFTLQQDSVLGMFYKDIIKRNLTVDKIDKKLSIITLTVNSKNELFSKYFVEVLAKTVSDFYIATKTKKSVQNVSILQHQTDSVRREMNNALTGVATSADNNPNPNPTLQVLRVPSQRRQVDVQANQAILTQLVTNLEISKVTLRKETPLIQIIDQPILPLEKEPNSKIIKTVVGGIGGGLLCCMYLLIIAFVKKEL